MFDFVTSDLHLGHAAVIGYSSRPFASVEEMDATLVSRHNALVGHRDVVLYVGDVAFGTKQRARELLASMNGRKILVLGNHDRSAGGMAELGFDLVADKLTLWVAGRKVRVSHLPYPGVRSVEDSRELEASDLVPQEPDPDARTESRPNPGGLPRWERNGAKEFLIHGHTHSTRRRDGQAIHVGVDAWDYRPAGLEEVVALMAEAESR